MANVNLTRVIQTPLPPVGSNPKSVPTKVKDSPAVREIAPLTDYNSKSGMIEPRKGWGANENKEIAATETDKDETPKKTPSKDRHEQWKKDQEAKKNQRETIKTEKAAKQQLLAKDYLQKGDILGAARALGTTPQELIALTQNAALSIPTTKERMTPEQKKLQDEKEYHEARERRIKDLETNQVNLANSIWIKENIAPVLKDTTKFELINRGDVSKISQAIFDYANKHYIDTCKLDAKGNLLEKGEVLDINEIAETIEQQYEEAAIASIEANKKAKKLAKYFTSKAEEEQEEPVEEEEAEEPAPLVKAAPSITDEEEDEEEQTHSSTVLTRRIGNGKTAKPFALMTSAEKLAFMRKAKR